MTLGIASEQICSQAGEDTVRKSIIQSPENYFSALASRTVHWFDAGTGEWISFDLIQDAWCGYRHNTGLPIFRDYSGNSFSPWDTAMDDSHSPFIRWFVGGQTNACF